MAVAWAVALTNVTAHSSVIGLQSGIGVPSTRRHVICSQAVWPV